MVEVVVGSGSCDGDRGGKVNGGGGGGGGCVCRQDEGKGLLPHD